MCLGIPGKVMRWLDVSPTFAQAVVEFDGVTRPVQMACVPDAKIGDYVIVHAGIAISQIDPEAAQRIFDELTQLQEDEGWHEAKDDAGPRT